MKLSDRWLGATTRRHCLLDVVKKAATTVIEIQRYPLNADKAHIALVSDEDLSNRTIIVGSHNEESHRYVVALIRKTPTTWWQAAGLFLARQMANRGRIQIIER